MRAASTPSSRSGRSPRTSGGTGTRRPTRPTTRPPSAHPNSIDQDYYISWNNKQAKDYSTASWGDGSVHRGNLLEDRVKKLVAAGGVTRAQLVKAMADAALIDLRAEDVLPKLLRVVNSSTVTDSTAAAAVSKLSAWLAAGAKRTETAAGSKTYADADAIRILDAWWPLLVQAEFQPGLGTDLYTAITANLPIDEAPSAAHGPTGSHAGSSFQYGWWSYVDKDIRAVLGDQVQGGLTQKYCGGGTLSGCRDILISTLKTAAGKTGRPGLPRRQALRGGQPVVRRLDRPAHAGRHQAQQHQLAEPADLPAGRRVHVTPVTTGTPRRRATAHGPPPTPSGPVPGGTRLRHAHR